MNQYNSKVKEEHLKRKAYLYIRQSSARQLIENQESTKRQYALREQAVKLGWPDDSIIVIDSDLGKSAGSTGKREGFQELVAEVGTGKAGLVMGLEVSRLARNSVDWHRLLEICALTGTLILDEEGIYEPGHFNDRLLLGLKGTMSEAELHFLKARLQGGIINKARRGELKTALPAGLIYSESDKVILDPDKQVQASFNKLFKTFQRTGSALKTVKVFHEQKLKFPYRPGKGPKNGEIVWGKLTHSRALQALRNPRYAGAFFYGRRRPRMDAAGKIISKSIPMEEWEVLLPDTHAGYISWEEYKKNRQLLKANKLRYERGNSSTMAREGSALLQGIAICGFCGKRMRVRYHKRKNNILEPSYVCEWKKITAGRRACQYVSGSKLDAAISDILIKSVTPLTLKSALAVQKELKSRLKEATRLQKLELDRAQYEAESAQRRYMHVDPANRLVADSLEADWNEKLKIFHTVKKHYEKQQQAAQTSISAEQQKKILSLAERFPQLWKNLQTPNRERKRMLRLLIEDVTIIKKDKIVTAHIRFKGGLLKTITIPLLRSISEYHATDEKIIEKIDELLNTHTCSEIAGILNEQGFRSGTGLLFTARKINRLCIAYKLKKRFERLREQGLLTRKEMAEKLGICQRTLTEWRKYGIVQIQLCDGKNNYLYEPPGKNPPKKMIGIKLSCRKKNNKVFSNKPKEVHHAC